MINYSFAANIGEVKAHQYPCFCRSCRNGEYAACGNRDYIGAWANRTMRGLGERAISVRFNSQNNIVQERVAVAILAKRYSQGCCQYSVSWEGEDEATWEDSDRLDCLDLIEEFEMTT